VPPIPGIEKAVNAFEIYFTPKEKIGKRVVMAGGGLVGCETALELVHRGCEVTVIEMKDRLLAESTGIYRTEVLDQMDKAGIASMVNTKCKEFRKDGVLVEDGNGNEKFIPADTVVYGFGMKAKREEVKALRKAAGDIPVFEIGDCVRSAKVGEAVYEGYTAAMYIV
jgi:NADPH-dependent 2,4-dienoyl-CoA reductase/sulfur reductase-like enzyme